MLQVLTPKRGTDGYGSGAFGAPRGTKTHRGIDYACYPGSRLLSPVKGRVTRHGFPYKGNAHFRYIEITDGELLRHRFMYVAPGADMGDLVEIGQIIGIAQDISGHHGITKKLTLTTAPKLTAQEIYKIKNPMLGHVHYEIKDEHGEYLNPEDQPWT